MDEEADDAMQQASSQPEFGKVELPPFLQEAQSQVWASMAARFAPGAKAAPAAAPTATAFQAPASATRRSAASVTPVLPSASAAALWGWSNGDAS